MGLFILRRLGVMLLTALCLTFIVFWLTNLYPNLEKLAKTQGNFRMSDEAVTSYLGDRGRCFDASTPPEDRPTRCGILQGDWGFSTVFKDEVGSTLMTRLALTGKLMFWVLMLMVPSALIVGVLAGMREGSKLDRSLSTIYKATTATPEYV
jgi:peptide/nickel transport system permease protein